MTTKILPVLKSSFTQPFLSLTALVELENRESARHGRTKLSWWSEVFTISGSTLAKSWRSILFITIWSTVIAVLDLEYGHSLALTNSITPLLSIVLGLLLVFRTTNAFARWESGRLSFNTLVSTIRTMTRSVWINVGSAIPPNGKEAVELTAEDIRSKAAFVRLGVAFVIATRRHARREFGTAYPDLQATLPASFHSLAKNNGYGFGAREAQLVGEIQREELDRVMASDHPATFEDPRSNTKGRRRTATILNESSPLVEEELFDEFLSKPNVPLPIIIAHQLGLWLSLQRRKGLVDSTGPLYNALSSQIDKLVDTFTTIEKLSIPIPRLFNTHLKQSTSAFLLSLPFVLVEILGWKMIPATSLIAFTLIGIEIIALEVEYPFGLDDSDLPLDLICAELRNEVEHTIARMESRVEVWL